LRKRTPIVFTWVQDEGFDERALNFLLFLNSRRSGPRIPCCRSLLGERASPRGYSLAK